MGGPLARNGIRILATGDEQSATNLNFSGSAKLAKVMLDGQSYEVGDDIRYAIDLVIVRYSAKIGHTTGHADSPRVVYDFPKGLQAQVAFNKKALVMVLRDRTADGRSLLKLLPPTWIKKVYPRDGNAGNALMSGKASTLLPSLSNLVLRLKLSRDDVSRVLDLYLGDAVSS